MVGTAPQLLLVDDDESSRLLLVQVLDSWGYEVAQARSGAEALRMLKQRTFDALLTDLEMPVITGFVLVREIRVREAQSGTRRMPVMAISGHATLAARRECVRLGFDRVLSKPFDWDNVRGALRELGGPGGLCPRKPLEVSSEVRSLLPSFLAARQEDCSGMVVALENGEFGEIDRLGHRLKGSGGSFGFPELSTIGELLEVAARERDAEGCAEALDALVATLREAVSRAA
ncbi:MAG: response regulator [Nannocystaceae bacterium]|nr:response regulator [Nannocystaceae bacterium]